MEKIKLLIFDMDGLMFETGRLAYRSYIESAKLHNYEVNPNVYYYLTGRTEPDIQRAMQEIYGEDAPVKKWRETTNAYRKKFLEEEQRVYKKKGLMELLDFAKEKRLKVALASSSSKSVINHYLSIEGLHDRIDFIVAGDEVTFGKPNPEIFLKACIKAQVNPEEAVVLEDSRAGITAAKKAGIRTFFIEDDITDLPDVKGEHCLLKDLGNFKEVPTNADYELNSLLQVREFLVENNSLYEK
ncbi:HAD family hydrolase [Enterococcus lemanii]|jgi:beta-phosphoglucomutase|uniref:HAD family hydrolase n=1 Tax=Enterococcus lemanii TaxID=1159752 RepID=A0ABV9MSX0_9ENTE|nr:HAD family phosphatase [Enterococcus lemanii]MBM7710130.1 HAD superfamily hydrolase (TIGR01509 family) [Enterococcus lemanii]NLM67510.1 HAD family phosphatase [Enterococcus sp.]